MTKEHHLVPTPFCVCLDRPQLSTTTPIYLGNTLDIPTALTMVYTH